MLAPFLTPKGGYFGDEKLRGASFDALWEPVDGPERLVSHLDAARGVPGVVGVKVTMEKGFGPFDVWPVFDAQMRARIRAIGAAVPVSLGPRILRADTAAIAAMTLWQAALGDWAA